MTTMLNLVPFTSVVMCGIVCKSKGTMVPTGEAWCENGGRRKPFYEQDPRNQNTIQQFLGMCRFEKTTNISCFQKKSNLKVVHYLILGQCNM